MNPYSLAVVREGRRASACSRVRSLIIMGIFLMGSCAMVGACHAEDTQSAGSVTEGHQGSREDDVESLTDSPLVDAARAGDMERLTFLVAGRVESAVDRSAVICALVHGHRDAALFLAGSTARQHTSLEWASPRSTAPHRLRISTQEEIYQALWLSAGQRFLVCFRLLPLQISCQSYEVLLFNQDLELLRKGMLVAKSFDWPYSLIQVVSNTDRLPDSLRGKPLLAAAVWPHEQEYEDSAQVVVGAPALRRTLKNCTYAVPLHWDDEVISSEYRADSELATASDLSVFWAEPGSSVIGVAGSARAIPMGEPLAVTNPPPPKTVDR